MPLHQRRTRVEMLEETRAKLVAAARQAFATLGFSSSSMDDFTAEIGLTRGAIYHHFGSKQGLLVAVIEQIEAEVDERLQAVSDGSPSLWEGFRRRCRTYLELALEPEIRRIILQDARAILGDVPQANQSTGIAALQSSLERLIAEGSVGKIHAGVTARMIYGAVTEASFWIAEPDGNLEERLAQALDSLENLLDGLTIR